MTGTLEGKVALITGVARGMGRSHAVRVAAEGADVIAIDICAQLPTVSYPMATPEDLAETARQVERLDRRIVTAQADVRDYPALTAAVDDAVAVFGGLDLVSANAGIGTYGAFLDIDPQQWQETIDTNLTGVYNTAKAAVPHIIAGRRGGSIVLTSSAITFRPASGLSAYIASKHGVVGFMRALALELAEFNIRVNSLDPTTVDTPMIQNPALWKVLAPHLDNVTRTDVEPFYRTLNAMQVPWIDAIDTSNALLFLFSEEARYITGIQLPVDAGTAPV